MNKMAGSAAKSVNLVGGPGPGAAASFMARLEERVRENPLALAEEKDLNETLGNLGFPTTRIDAFIHGRQYEDNERTRLKAGYTCSHLEHQMKISEIVRGLEKHILNDPTFDNPIRPRYLNGKTGRISSVLTSCYFNLYEEMIRIGVEYDIEYTLKFIFNFLFYIQLDATKTKFVMPTPEFEALRRILEKAMCDSQGNYFIFYDPWWEEYMRIVEEKLAIAPTKGWYDPNSNDSSMWTTLLGYVTKAEKPYLMFSNIETELWEYRPCYVSDRMTIRFQSTLMEHLSLIRRMFVEPETVENEDIQCDTTSCRVAGGGRRKLRNQKKRKTQKKRGKGKTIRKRHQ